MHKAYKQTCAYEVSNQSMKSFSTHYNQTMRLIQRVGIEANWNRVTGALNLDIESQGEADERI